MKWYDQLAAEVRRLMTAHQLSTVLTKPAIFVKFVQTTPLHSVSCLCHRRGRHRFEGGSFSCIVHIFFPHQPGRNSNASGAAPAAASGGISSSRSSGDDSFYLGYSMQNLCRIRVHVRRSEEQCRGEDGRPHGVWSARVTSAVRQVESAAREGPFYFTILGSGVRELDYKSS
jgi:hypothetical protein